MDRVTCQECHMRFDAALGNCPNCGAAPTPLWRRMAGWRWPLPLAIGLLLQVLSSHVGLAGHPAVLIQPGARALSRFIAGTLFFTVLATLLLYALYRARIAWRGAHRRRRRRGTRRQAR